MQVYHNKMHVIFWQVWITGTGISLSRVLDLPDSEGFTSDHMEGDIARIWQHVQISEVQPCQKGSPIAWTVWQDVENDQPHHRRHAH